MGTIHTLKNKLMTSAPGTAQAGPLDDAVTNAQNTLNTYADAYGKAVQEQDAAQHQVDEDKAEVNIQKTWYKGHAVNCPINENPSFTPIDTGDCGGSDVAGAQAQLKQAQDRLNAATDRVNTLKAWVFAALKARNDAVAARDQANAGH